MKSNMKNLQGIREIVSLVVLVLIVGFGINPPAHAADSLYVGDQTDPSASDNTVKRFDAETGDFLGAFVTLNSGDLHGPRGLIFDHARLLVVNQNQDLEPLSGAVLRYNGKTGAFLKAIVPATDTSFPDADPNAPRVPRGVVLWDKKIVLADFSASAFCPPLPCLPGRLLVFTKNGKFLANLNPIGLSTEFHPRGVVVGPDGLLYVSNFPDLATGLGGQVLRFDPETGNFTDVFITSAGGVGELNRPEGLVFGPDGNLYITSFRDNSNIGIEGNTDMIRIYNGTTGSFIDKIDLDVAGVGQPRAFAQALLFGPGGFLFVPITGSGPDKGAVRRYNVADKTFVNFVSPSAEGGPLGEPWYLTFGDTDPGTLEYTPVKVCVLPACAPRCRRHCLPDNRRRLHRYSPRWWHRQGRSRSRR